MPGDPSQDQDFLQAHPGDQHAYLMQTDPDYAKAPPQDQTAYLNYIWSTNLPKAPTLPVEQQHGILNPRDPVQQAQDKVYGTSQEGQLNAAPLPFPVSAAVAPGKMALSVGRSALGGYGGSKVGERFGPVGRVLGGLIGAGIGYKSPEMAEGVANRVIGEENVPMGMKSPQSIGKMIHGARDEMYNDLGNRAMTPATPPPTEPPATPQGPTRVNQTPGGLMPPGKLEHTIPQGPTRINKGLDTSAGLTGTSGGDSGVLVVPEPNKPFAGENEGYMASVPREEELPEMAKRGKPGAGKQLQQIGKTIIYKPKPTIGTR